MALFGQVSDVEVTMTIQQPQATVGLGNILILNPVADLSTFKPVATTADGVIKTKTDASGAVYAEYGALDAVGKDFTTAAGVYKKANAYLAQEYASDRVAVLTYAVGKGADALASFWHFNWTFAVLASDADAANITTLSNTFEAQKDRFLFLQYAQIDSVPTAVKSQNYTVVVIHADGEELDAAWIGQEASRTVGSVDWKECGHLSGITADDITTGEFKAYQEAHANAYVNVGSGTEMTESTTMSGEYIDSLHGDMWIKSNIQSGLQGILQAGPKTSYDSAGIALLQAKVTEVLSNATAQGIILVDDTTKQGDFTVTASPRSAQSAGDLSARKYSGLSFSYRRSGSIHSVVVNGVVKSDTTTD